MPNEEEVGKQIVENDDWYHAKTQRSPRIKMLTENEDGLTQRRRDRQKFIEPQRHEGLKEMPNV